MNENEFDQSLKLIAKSSIIVFVGFLFSKILTYGYRIIIARYFGPEVYGLFALALIVFNLFVAFSTFGLAEGIVRYVSLYRGKGEKNKISYIFKLSLSILIVSSLISGLVLFILSETISIDILHNFHLILVRGLTKLTRSDYA